MAWTRLVLGSRWVQLKEKTKPKGQQEEGECLPLVATLPGPDWWPIARLDASTSLHFQALGGEGVQMVNNLALLDACSKCTS